MGRRKKETPEFHRDAIAYAAEPLFVEKGILATTMDDIAKEAKYSKATLYVYYKNKEEIVSTLVLKSMKMLQTYIHLAIVNNSDTKERYLAICSKLVSYHKNYPFYYEIVIGEINVDFQDTKATLLDKEVFDVGECINEEIGYFMREGVRQHIFREDIKIPQTVFLFWSSLSGIIVMAEKKRMYIEQSMGISIQEFREYSFMSLLRSIMEPSIIG